MTRLDEPAAPVWGWECRLVAYRKRKDAERALQDVVRARMRHAAAIHEAPPVKFERHAYRCRHCKQWHLTSQGVKG